MTVVITDPNLIQLYRLRVLLSGIRLEIAGLRKGHRSCSSIVAEEFGWKGSRQSIHDRLERHIMEKEQEAGITHVRD